MLTAPLTLLLPVLGVLFLGLLFDFSSRAFVTVFRLLALIHAFAAVTCCFDMSYLLAAEALSFFPCTVFFIAPRPFRMIAANFEEKTCFA